MSNFKDLTGQRFGRLVVIKRIENYRFPSGKAKTVWLCKCDCGNERLVAIQNLKPESSCGCWGIEKVALPLGEASLNQLFRTYKNQSIRRNISFELSKKYFIKLTKQNCFYCGKFPSQIVKARHNQGDYIYNGIDRIDPKMGYTIKNTVSCCKICNQGKWSQTREDFFEWIKTVHNNLTGKGLI